MLASESYKINCKSLHLCDYAGARPGFPPLIFFGMRPGTNDDECRAYKYILFEASVSPFIVLYWFWYRYTTVHVITSGVPEAESL